MDSKTDTEIVHEFMGLDWRKGRFSWRPGADDPMTIEHLDHYFTSWGWIMPVVEKISEFGTWTIRPGFAMVENDKGIILKSRMFKFAKSTDSFEEQDGEAVKWVFIVPCVCLDYIKWYNEQNLSEHGGKEN